MRRPFCILCLLLLSGMGAILSAQGVDQDGRPLRKRGGATQAARSMASAQASAGIDDRLRQNFLRVETPVFEDDRPFSVLPLGELGVAVVMNQNELGRPKPQRSLAFYDENLQLRWQAAVEVAAEYQYLGYRLGADSLYFALSCLPHYKSEQPLASLTVCLADGAWRVTYLPVALPAKTEILSMQMHADGWGWLALEKDGYVWYCLPGATEAGATEARQPEDTTAHMAADGTDMVGTGAAGRPASLPVIRTPLGVDDRLEWCHIATDTADGFVYTLFRDRKLRQTGLTLCRHDWRGNDKTGFEILPPDEDLRLIDAKISVLPAGRLWIGGTYHLSREKQTVSSYDRGSETTGLFATLYAMEKTAGIPEAASLTGRTAPTPRQLTFWKRAYYDFPDLENRLSREAWYDLQRAREKAKGRTLIPAFTTQVRVGRMAAGPTDPDPAPLYVLGEVYTRVVNTTTEMYYDAYGRMVPYTRTFFEGFRFRDGFLARFDSLGHAVTEAIFDLDRNRLYDELTDYSQWAADTGGRTLYAYPIDDQLAYRVLGAVSGTSGEPAAFLLPPLYQYDKVQKSWGGMLIPWYGHNYLAFGYQQIRNTRLSGGRRNVFYLQKITVD